MRTLQQLAREHPNWSLDQFVQVVNELLPQFLPSQKAHTRVKEEVTPRLVRHYTSQGLLDEPIKQGRNAVYTYRHLLQTLIVRRLLVEGYGASAIDNLVVMQDNQQLEALLQGGVQLAIKPTNPALGFLQQIQQRQSISPLESMEMKSTQMPSNSSQKLAHSTATPKSSTTHWYRLEVLPGLEIHIRDDFIHPNSFQEQQNLIQHITQQLLALFKHRRSSQ
jgi:DNA-binding transcriptional MerR regulator